MVIEQYLKCMSVTMLLSTLVYSFPFPFPKEYTEKLYDYISSPSFVPVASSSYTGDSTDFFMALYNMKEVFTFFFLWNGYRSLLMWKGPNSLIMMLFIMTSCLYHFSSLWRSPKASLLRLSAGRSCDRAMFIRISIAFWRRSNRPRTYQMPLNEALASSRPVCHFYCLFIFTVCWVDKKQNKTKKAYLMFTKVHASKRLSK